MILRQARPCDAKKLFVLEQELFEPQNYPLSYSSFVYHIRNNLLFLAEEEGMITGYILVLIKRKTPKIYSLGISKNHRKKGIGARLLTHAVEKLRAKGFLSLVLEVRTDNTPAQELYKKFGFVRKRIEKEFYKDGCDALIMELTF